MRHDLEAALPADLKGSADLVVEQKRMGVEVPSRAHDAAREVELDMVDAVFDLLADGFHPTMGPSTSIPKSGHRGPAPRRLFHGPFTTNENSPDPTNRVHPSRAMELSG